MKPNIEIALRSLITAGYAHMTKPDARAFTSALQAAESSLPAGADPMAKPAQPLRAYKAPAGNPWPSTYAAADAVLAACVGGATEGQAMSRINARQFATRHALHRLADEGWLYETKPHEKASYIYEPKPSAYMSDEVPPGPTLRAATPEDVAAVRAGLPDNPEEATDIERRFREGYKGADMKPHRAEILAGAVEIKEEGQPSLWWLPPMPAEPPPPDETDDLPTD